MSKIQFRNFSITSKFILWFLIVALAPLIVSTFISYRSSRNVLKEEVSKILLAIAENKANQVRVYLDKKEEDVVQLSHMSDVIVAVERFDEAYDVSKKTDSPEYAAVDQEFRPFLSYYQKALGFEDLFLVRAYGDVIFSVKRKKMLKSIYAKGPYKDTQLAEVFVEANKSKQTEVSDFEYFPQVKKGYVFIASPVFRGGEVIGVVVAQLGTEEISRLVQDYSDLGSTGEFGIAAKIKDEVVFIAPLRFDREAAFKKRVPIGSKEYPNIQKAVMGERGSGVSMDYRGKEVMSVWRHLPTFRWGMVVKMDTTEVFVMAKQLRNNLLRISIVLLIIVAVIAIIIAKTVSSPIRELTTISGEIADGNLSARVEIDTKDEIGELAQSFNQMTDKLVRAKEDVEQKNVEVEEQKKMLEQVNKELDSFVYTASHDLRAPLRGISSFASFLEEDYKDKLDDEGRDYLKEIREGTDRMNQLIEDLLALSRISRIKNPYENINVEDMLSSVIKRIEFDIKENNVDLRIQPDMPTIRCDRIKLSEVFLNLISNAIKFSSKNNKENPRVEVGYASEDGFHKFYVKDNGIGIDHKYHSQVFGIFKRLHTAKEYEGTGAGLSIVKRVIDDHGGNIWIESEVGKGATFCFSIPKDLKKKKKIGEILIEEGLVSEEKLKEKLKAQGLLDGPPEYKGSVST
ncbi:ATP-binding protein [Candidatus Omnitrophota bacterium]